VAWQGVSLLRLRFRPPPTEPDVNRFDSSGSPVIPDRDSGRIALTSVTDDAQNGLGCSHLAYLARVGIGSPAPLRQVVGFPNRRLLLGLCHPRARAP
jgi:hypothetical protein